MDDDLCPDTPLTRPIRTQIDLEDLWHDLMGPLGFSSPSVWLVMIGPDDRPLPQITEIAECFEVPTPDQQRGFGDFLRVLTQEVLPGGRVALLRSRPGTEGLGAEDRQWAQALYAAARGAGVPCEIVHVADDTHLVPVPLDEITLPRSA